MNKFAYYLARGLTKESVDVEAFPRNRNYFAGPIERWIYGSDELGPPKEEDLDNWRNIADYMHAARPSKLESAKVLTGRINSDKLIDQLDSHRNWDSVLEHLQWIRPNLANSYSRLPESAYEQMGASYHPYLHSVIVNTKSPGALIHELGHAIDMAPRKREPKIIRDLRWRLKPTLWKELSAWKKGRKAFQEGYAASPESQSGDHSEYVKNMASYQGRKFPAFGTYLGGATGALLGAIGGGVAGYYANIRGNLLPMVGATVGTLLGIPTGAKAGQIYAKIREKPLARKALVRLAKLQKENPEKMNLIRERIKEIRSARASKDKGQEEESTKEANWKPPWAKRPLIYPTKPKVSRPLPIQLLGRSSNKLQTQPKLKLDPSRVQFNLGRQNFTNNHVVTPPIYAAGIKG